MIPRREALKVVAGAVGYIYGQSSNQRGGEMRLILDNVDAIYVQYRGQMVRITPQELMYSLTTQGK